MLVKPHDPASKKFENWFECVTCGSKSRIITRWNHELRSYEVVCGVCGHDEFRPRRTLTKQWMEDPESVSAAVQTRLAEKHRDELITMIRCLPTKELRQAMKEKYFGNVQWEQGYDPCPEE